MKILIVALLLSIPTFAKDNMKLKESLNNVKTNLEMKKISKKLTKSFEEKLKRTVQRIKKGLKGQQLKSFVSSQQNWEKYLESEDTFLMHEFGQKMKHGSSASLTSRMRKNQLLESRLKYLEALSENI